MKEPMKLYQISADGGLSWTVQRLTAAGAANERANGRKAMLKKYREAESLLHNYSPDGIGTIANAYLAYLIKDDFEDAVISVDEVFDLVDRLEEASGIYPCEQMQVDVADAVRHLIEYGALSCLGNTEDIPIGRPMVEYLLEAPRAAFARLVYSEVIRAVDRYELPNLDDIKGDDA